MSLNGVAVNLKTLGLAGALIAGFAFAADLGYRLLAEGAADMTRVVDPVNPVDVADEPEATMERGRIPGHHPGDLE